MNAPSHDRMFECLKRFQGLVNSNGRVKKLLKGWEPIVLIEPTDADARYYLSVRGAEVAEVTHRPERELDGSEHLVHVRGAAADLERVFSGQESAARAVLDATLEVFARDGDQVKLDAITLVLWGA
jgi:hypothetical protein